MTGRKINKSLMKKKIIEDKKKQINQEKELQRLILQQEEERISQEKEIKRRSDLNKRQAQRNRQLYHENHINKMNKIQDMSYDNIKANIHYINSRVSEVSQKEQYKYINQILHLARRL